MSILLISISYFTFRYESVLLIAQYIALFVLYLFLTYQKNQFSLKEIIAFGILFRLLLILLIPNLSEDVYRFLWDGKLWWEGVDAYAYLPSELAKKHILSSDLFAQLNSPNYYSIYPPLNQLIFAIGGMFENTSTGIVIIRLFIILAEIGTLILLPKVLKYYQQDPKLLLLYALNPLVILELSGNLHFEAFVIFFLIWAIFEFERQAHIRSAVSMGLAISFKLVPLILLASFFKKLDLKRYVQFIFVASSIAVLSFIPFLFSDALHGIMKSTSLYFQSFEFNASLYYLIREIGFVIKGFNIIATSGPWMGILSFSVMVIFNSVASAKIKLPERMLWTYVIYFLFATTVHPWYVVPILILGTISGYRFPILWTFSIFFTYWGYSINGYQENLGIVAFEYISLLCFIVIELIQKKKNRKIGYA
jgi:alpha-1,6-mannosyltransferase